MNEMFGGISREEYCNQIQTLATAPTDNPKNTWTNEEWDNWSAAYEKHCMEGK